MATKTFLTEYTRDNVKYGAHIFAASEDEAKTFCITGETVVGESTVDNDDDIEYGFPLVEYFLNIDEADDELKPVAYFEFLAYLNTYAEIIKERLPQFATIGSNSWIEQLTIIATVNDQDNPLYVTSRESFIPFLDAVTEALPERFIKLG